MGADSPAKNTQNVSKKFSPKCLPKPKSSRSLKKSIVHGWNIAKVGYAGWMGAAVTNRAVSLPYLCEMQAFHCQNQSHESFQMIKTKCYFIKTFILLWLVQLYKKICCHSYISCTSTNREGFTVVQDGSIRHNFSENEFL